MQLACAWAAPPQKSCLLQPPLCSSKLSCFHLLQHRHSHLARSLDRSVAGSGPLPARRGPQPRAEARPSLPLRATPSASQLYTSQAYEHQQTVGSIYLDDIPGKGLGWRAARDLSPGELLLTSLPLAVLYGSAGSPPSNEELTEALTRGWQRMTRLERSWLQLLCDCCSELDVAATSSVGSGGKGTAGRKTAEAVAEEQQHATAGGTGRQGAGGRGSLLERAQRLVQPGVTGVANGDVDGYREPEQLTGGTSFPQLQDFSPPAPLAPSHAPASTPSPTIVSLATHSSGGTAAMTPAPPSVPPLLVQRYSYCEGLEDAAVAELQEAGDPGSCAGLWPELALLNHSCAPNAIVVVVGGAAYVRAARPIVEGEEVVVSYLGEGRFLDVAGRRALLRSSHGFLCGCPRCRMEQHHFPTVRYPQLDSGPTPARHSAAPPSSPAPSQDPKTQQHEQQQQQPSVQPVSDEELAAALLGRKSAGPLWGAVMAVLDMVSGTGRYTTAASPERTLLRDINRALETDLTAAVQATLTAQSRVRSQQADLLARMTGLILRVREASDALDLPTRAQLLVLASVYGIVRLASELAEIGGTADPEQRLDLRRTAAEVLEAAAPGSDAHVCAAIRHMDAVRGLYGSASVEGRAAELAAARAHVARYGKELVSEPGLLKEMLGVRRRLMTGSALAASMGAMAWVQQVDRGLGDEMAG